MPVPAESPSLELPSLELPSLELLRALSDRHVLAALASAGELTRAGLASVTGLSKPTVSQAISRLIASGVVVEAGVHQGARGRSGTNLAINDSAGMALAIVAGPEGVRGDLVSLDGRILGSSGRALHLPVSSATLSRALRGVCRVLTDQAPGPVRVVTLSVADPVDARSGRLVALPESPFVTGDLDVRGVLSDELSALILEPVIDNDVNWAALAEHAARAKHAAGATREGSSPQTMLHIYLGHGIGAAVIMQGQLLHGARGLAGELGYARTDSGETLMGRLRNLKMLRPGTSTIDIHAARSAVDSDSRRGQDLVDAVASAIASASYLLDPGLVVLDGPWGESSRLRAGVQAYLARLGGLDVAVSTAMVGPQAPSLGARTTAIQVLLESWTPHSPTSTPASTQRAATV